VSSAPLQDITAATRLILLLGDPVAHSLSPRFQNAAIRHRGLDAVYAVLRCDAQSVAPIIRALCRAGGAGNVTVPHKATAAQCIEQPTEVLRRTGACNTFWGEDGTICGDNTDVAGFRHAATALLQRGTRAPAASLRGVHALIVGAGGAAAAATCALLDDGAAGITLINRSPDRARTLAARLDPAGGVIDVVTTVAALRGRSFDLVVNASSIGLADTDPLPLDLAIPGNVGAVLDLVYRRDSATPWVRHAREHGITAADGAGMLIAQGAAAFQRWFRVEAPAAVMQRALEG
jgi:shikimate dehydrogenase